MLLLCKSIDDIENLAIGIAWRAHASLKVNEPNSTAWYTQEKYKNSIYNVVAKGIEDCVTGRAEFKDIHPSKDEVVEFDAKPTKNNPYTAENWNAVVLWNLLSKSISGDDEYAKGGFYIGVKGSDEVVEQVGKLIIEEYKSVVPNVEIYVNNAVWDIKQYANELRLYEFIADWEKKCWMFYKNPEEQKHKEINRTMIERSNQIYNTILYQYQGTDCQFNQNIKNFDTNDADKNHWDFDRQERIYKNGGNTEVIEYIKYKRSKYKPITGMTTNIGIKSKPIYVPPNKRKLNSIHSTLCSLLLDSLTTVSACDKLFKKDRDDNRLIL